MQNIVINVVKSLMMSIKELIYVAGPTAIGKTSISILLAKYFKTEIISCDARQLYMEMSIGTAVPSKLEQQEIKHHFIQNKSIHKPYNAGKFEKEGLRLLKNLFQKHDKIIMVGGSGLYAKALIDGLDKFPKIEPKAVKKVKELYQSSGLKGLKLALAKIDPEYYQTVDKKNPRRLIRALEVCESVQKPFSFFLNQTRSARPFKSKTLFLQMPREHLYKRINQRVDQMLDSGLEKEARNLLPHKELLALQTVGYKELFRYFEGKTKFHEAIEEIKKNTRNYAKRQLTWYKKENTICIEMDEISQTFDQIIKKLN